VYVDFVVPDEEVLDVVQSCCHLRAEPNKRAVKKKKKRKNELTDFNIEEGIN